MAEEDTDRKIEEALRRRERAAARPPPPEAAATPAPDLAEVWPRHFARLSDILTREATHG